MDTFAQNALKGSGNCFDQRTVKFGSEQVPDYITYLKNGMYFW